MYAVTELEWGVYSGRYCFRSIHVCRSKVQLSLSFSCYKFRYAVRYIKLYSAHLLWCSL